MRISLTLFLLLSAFRMDAQQAVCRPIPFLGELPLNSIFTLYQDSQGCIWAGTAAGAARYDGYSTRLVTNNWRSPHALASNDVRALSDDSLYIWAGTTAGLTLISKSDLTTRPFPDNRLATSHIREIFRDRSGQHWVTAGHSVCRCSATRGVIKTYNLPCRPNTLYQDRSGRLYLLGDSGCILRYNPKSDKFLLTARLGEANIYRMAEDNRGHHYIATWGDGLWLYRPEADTQEKMFAKQHIVNPIRQQAERVFYDITTDSTFGYIWTLSHFRLYILTPDADGTLHEAADPRLTSGPQPIDFQKTYSRIITDRQGTLWIGAFDQGHTISFEQGDVENHLIKGVSQSLGLDPNVIYLAKDSQGTVWFDQARYGLCLYDERTGRTTYGLSGRTPFYNIDVGIITPSRFDGSVWLGGRESYSRKVWKAVQRDMRITLTDSIDLASLPHPTGSVRQIAELNKDLLLIATADALLVYNPTTRRINETRRLDSPCADMAVTQSGAAIVACIDKVIMVKPSGTRLFPLGKYLLEGEEIKECCLPSGHSLYLATTLGRLLQLDTATAQLRNLTQTCQMSGAEILELVSDRHSSIYVLTNKSIKRISLADHSVTAVYQADSQPVLISAFRYGAAFVDNFGTLYAGGHKGFVKINPAHNKPHRHPNVRLAITDITADGHSLLGPAATTTKATLKPSQRNIEIHFSSFQYKASRQVRYAYRLDGIDNRWILAPIGSNTAYYNSLSRGRHLFHVRTTDEEGHWLPVETTFEIQREPAWYETAFAFLLYILTALCAAVAATRLYTRRLKSRNAEKLGRELQQMRLNYFTSVSHELLTPLTAILAAVEAAGAEVSAQTAPLLGILRSNAERLKTLIQQTLDFWKLENLRLTADLQQTDISSRLRALAAGQFQPVAHGKGIRLITDIEDNITGEVDADKLDKIVSNLLSNAIKYTPEGQTVSLEVSQVSNSLESDAAELNIVVADEGPGIAKAEQSKIFTKFYYSPDNHGQYASNGIGLALTKELVSLHHGTITVESQPPHGATFRVRLPLKGAWASAREQAQPNGAWASAPGQAQAQKPNDQLQPQYTDNQTCSQQTDETSAPTLLFVDDNNDLLLLLRSLFSPDYRVLTASSGQEALAILREEAPDIIVCDLMMPGMSGDQLCRQIKQDTQTAHIPVIMLTAKHDAADHAESYRIGAESYLTKPFDTAVLRARIDNLLSAARKRQQAFQQNATDTLPDIDYQAPDKELLQRAIDTVLDHIQDSDYDTVRLASDLCMSRSTLYRKLRALTGLSPLEFTRNIRLKHAAELLRRGAGVAEAAYATGFSTPKYFTRQFKEAFGKTPSEVMGRQQGSVGFSPRKDANPK